MKQAVQGLVGLMELEQLEVDLFRGQSQDVGQGSLFGGLVAGQALRAATLTVPEERLAHSLHAYFLRPGDVKRPIVYEVDRIRDGRGFTTRRVRAVQNGRAIFSLSASFQILEEGPDHQSTMPDVPHPETLESDEPLRLALAEHLPPEMRHFMTSARPVEIRPVDPRHPLSTEAREPAQQMWFRLADTIDADPGVHQALLAFCSDYSFMGTSMLPHGLSFWHPGVQAASIDHAMWFLRPCRVDEWLLYSMDSPSAYGARGFSRGEIYREDGTLVATTAQEGLIRVKKEQ
ncbi:MAG TPA: acyl-CoA thioesterase II [Alcanivoracaceae bacterium]|nr:acyl-CoA thioesterase II [Alcanivoracaceae bacterium]